MNEKGVYHLDIKVENIMVKMITNDEIDFKLIDFGHSYCENTVSFSFLFLFNYLIVC